MTEVLVATRSIGKLAELRELLSESGWHVIDPRQAGIPEMPFEEFIEQFDTFEANALAKARYFHGICGLPTIADDSGLEVSALGGRPGVRSRRYSGRGDLSGAALDAANNAVLLAELAPHLDRSARFVCAAAYVDAEREVVRRGESGGDIIDDARGSAGFGYDPHFLSRDLGRTFAEIDGAAKATVSHRGRAMRALLSAVLARR